jgi:exosortase
VTTQPQSEMTSSTSVKSYNPWFIFGICVAVCCIVFSQPLFTLFRYALGNDDASHIVVVPFVSAWLFYVERKKFQNPGFDLRSVTFFLVPAVCLAAAALFGTGDRIAALPLFVLSFLFFVCASFVGTFGLDNFRRNWFPLSFLLFLVPLPESLLNRFIYILQSGSAKVAETIFDWTGVPALREGFIFKLPRISIEVATECSGIRSSLALLILALLVAHFSFSKFWKKVVFVAAGLLMMVVKNGVRIAILTILANNVNPEFLYGRLHRDGGVVFFLLGLSLLIPVYWLLRRGEISVNQPVTDNSLSI